MRSLPVKAQIYVVVVYVLGTLSALGAAAHRLPSNAAPLWELGVFMVLAVLAGGKKVRLMRHTSQEDVGSMSLGFAITFAAMLRLGPAAAVLVTAASTLSSALYPRPQRLFQLAFNVALSMTETFCSSLLFLWLNGGTLQLDPLLAFPAVTASSLSFFAINTGGVAVVIALCTEQPPMKVWRETFMWTAPSYFAGAGITTLAILICGSHTGAILLFVSPVAYLTYQSYAVYTASAEQKQKHIEELQVSQAQLADLYLATIKSLALAIDAKDQYTHQHILRVQRFAVATAKHMGLNGADLEGVTTGALLHDIGKLGVPEYVLLKPGRLTAEEFSKIQKHPEIGAAILDPVDFPWPVLPAVKYHHEKWNGTGYPEGLRGEEIPLTARILAVADVYDALTSVRAYRTAWPHEKAVELIKKDSGEHFDPAVVNAFLAVIDGVVEEMANEGHGPLVIQHASAKPVTTKADEVARDIHRASAELWALYEVVQTLSCSLGMTETLEILGRKLEAIMPGTACLFLIRQEETDSLVTRSAVGINQPFFIGCHTINAQSPSYRVARERKTYLGEYDTDDLLVNSVQGTQWTALHSAIIVPIVHQDTVLGTINLYHPDMNAFSSHDRQLLETIAERAAMALFNGILFDRTLSNAFSDPLTGLHNVRFLTEYVDGRCHAASVSGRDRLPGADIAATPASEQAASSLRLAMLCLDLDSFKPVNDNFGHLKGDQVLRDLSRLFRDVVREGDFVARYGGDEFVIVLNNAGPEEAADMARRLQRAVASYDPGLVHPRLGSLRLGASIGWACFPADGADCTSLLSTADGRMYENKTERKLGRLVSRADDDSDEHLPKAA